MKKTVLIVISIVACLTLLMLTSCELFGDGMTSVEKLAISKNGVLYTKIEGGKRYDIASLICGNGLLYNVYPDGEAKLIEGFLGTEDRDEVSVKLISQTEDGRIKATLSDGLELYMTKLKDADGMTAFERFKKDYEYEHDEKDWYAGLIVGTMGGDTVHVVQFDTGDGTKIEPQRVKHLEKAIKPEDPTLENHEFLGWFYNDEQWTFSGCVVTENMTITARWKRIACTVSFVDENGEKAAEPINVSLPFNGTLSSLMPAVNPPRGYVFTGWLIGEQPFDPSTIVLDKDIVLTAKFQLVTYKIVYSGIPDNINPNPKTYNVNTQEFTLAAPTTLGERFLGWFSDSVCTKRITSFKPDLNNLGTVTIYGKTTGWWDDITYQETNLRFKMTKNSNSQELPSGCERYLAGESDDISKIDEMVDARNNAALKYTKVTLTYSYFEEGNAFGWSKCIDKINQEVMSGSSSIPDMYCNFLTDVLSTSLLGSFANLCSRQHGDNFMTRNQGFMSPGYMSELMTSLTLNNEKMYVVASDYFIDLIRAFFIVPVNVKLYNQVAYNIAGLEDYTGDGVKDISDFFGEVYAGKWTYERVAQYSAAIYSNDSGETTANLGDTVGFALSSSSGLSSAGMVYTSSVVVIHKELDTATGKYNYDYPDDGSELVSLTNALTVLFKSTGVASVSDQSGNRWGTSSLQAIRNQFARGKVLFGGVILLGSLEFPEYQNMKTPDIGGYGIVPPPVFRAKMPDGTPTRYNTQIHVVGRAGGISWCTKKFTQCTAFLHYQSTNSTDILEQYWNTNLCYDIADGVEGNFEMLQYIRSNVRTCFDKLFEDSIGFFFNLLDAETLANRWHNLISTSEYTMTNMAEKYSALYGEKEARLKELVLEYNDLPE